MIDGTGNPDSYSPLAALGRQLAVRGLSVAPQLHIATPDATSDTITCRPRPDDGGRLWFFTADGTPIAEADDEHLDDAALYAQGRLVEREMRSAGAS